MTSEEVQTTRPVPRWLKFCYGLGSVAYGVKDNGLSFFLLIYYNQILGLHATLVGLALLISLLIDGVSDPIVGYVSDRIKTRWGRRHPFMYCSAVPALLCYFYLWNPPLGLSQAALFAYLITLTVTVRLALTFYETPSTALVAEITDSYHQRTNLLSFRFFFGWWGGLTMALLSYGVLLAPTEAHPDGQLNPEGYQAMGLIGGGIIFSAILISAIGTHPYIKHLKKPPPSVGGFAIARMWREVKESLSNPSFLYLFIAAIFSAMAAGIVTGLNIYINTYFWEFSSQQIFLTVVTNFFSAAIAVSIATPLSRLLGKKLAAILTSLVAFTLLPLPVLLRLMDVLPANGGEPLYMLLGIPVTPILNVILITNMIDVILIIASSILLTSMIADLVEDSQIETGRRSEGLFFAARTFILKAMSGLGGMISTIILVLSGFPRDAKPGAVAPEILWNLGILYAPLLLCLYAIAIFFLTGYRINQQKHESNLRILSARAKA